MHRKTPLGRSLTGIAAVACVVLSLARPTAGAAAAVGDGQLSGRIQDSAGVALPGADVALADPSTGAAVAHATSDAKGAYNLTVPRGNYDASVSATGPNGAQSQGRLRGIAVAGGSKLTIALLMPQAAGSPSPGSPPAGYVTFSGAVRDRGGVPVPGIGLTLTSNNVYQSARTGSDGRFSLSAPPGRYNFTLSGSSSSTGGAAVAIPANFGFYVNGFDLTGDFAHDITIPGKDMTVSVRDEAGAAQAGAAVTAGTFSTNETIELFPGASATSMWNVGSSTGADGRVTFIGLPNHALGLTTVPADPGLGRTYKTVALTKDTTFNIVAHPNVTFSGVVRNYDGSAVAGASVQLTNSESNGWATTTSDGHFSVAAPRGSYTLWLVSNPSLGAGAPNDWINVNLPIDITGDRTQDLTIPGTTMRAHVTDPSGTPVAGAAASSSPPSFDPSTPSAAVTLFPGGTGSGWRQSNRTTDASGDAQLLAFPGATVSVSARPPADVRTLAPATPRQVTVDAAGWQCDGGARDFSYPVSGHCVADMALRGTVSLHGVVDPAAPHGGVQLYLYNGPGGADVYQSTSAADGSYEIHAPTGHFDSIGISSCCSADGLDRPASWHVQGGPVNVTGDAAVDFAPPFTHATIRGYDASGTALRLAASDYGSDNPNGPLGGSVAPGVPAMNGYFSGSASGGFATQVRLPVLGGMAFHVQQYYDGPTGAGGMFPTLKASGLSVAADGDIALVVTTITPLTPPSSSTTTTTTGAGGTTTTTRPGATTTTTGPSGSSTTTTTTTTTTITTIIPKTTPTTSPAGDAARASTPGRSGYWMTTADGEVAAFGDAVRYGDPHGTLGGARVVHLEPTPTGQGYWILDNRGRVHPYGDAKGLGDVDPVTLAGDETPTSLSATPTGAGYWIFTTKGRVLTFGNAAFYGDMSKTKLNGAVLGSVATPTGRGYYLVASDGGIFTFGDAAFHGSTGNLRLNRPVMGMAPAPGGGYWLVASDGGIFAFDVPFFGSMGGTRLNKPISGMVPGRNGYLMVGEDGGIFSFGTVAFHGSLGGRPPASPVVSAALLP